MKTLVCHGWRQHRNLDDLGVHSIAQYTDDVFTKADFFFFFPSIICKRKTCICMIYCVSIGNGVVIMHYIYKFFFYAKAYCEHPGQVCSVS